MNDGLLYFIAMQLNHNGSVMTEILRQLALTNCQLGIDISPNKDKILGLIDQQADFVKALNDVVLKKPHEKGDDA